MKTRSGFVSNSSSSSFIVAFSKKVKTKEDVLKEMFPKGERAVICEYGWDDDSKSLDSLTAAELVFDQISKNKPLSKQQIIESISSGYFEGFPEYDFYSDKEESRKIEKEHRDKYGIDIRDEKANKEMYKKWNKALQKEWGEHDAKIREAAKLFYKNHKHLFEGKVVYAVEFGDNHGPCHGPTGNIMENGDAFDALPHVVVSNH